MGVFKTFQNIPLETIPIEKRVKKNTVTICKGGCNSIKKIYNTTYQLCQNCSSKWRYYGQSCDVPNCEAVCEGTIRFQTRENKILCRGCGDTWKNMNYCTWERLVEKRHSWFLRPQTFVKALELGLVTTVEKNDRVEQGEIAECYSCKTPKRIWNNTYQLCSSCGPNLQFHGEICGVCEIHNAMMFDEEESIFVCQCCVQRTKTHKISSYQIYKTQIRTITNCQICYKSISHDNNGNRTCSAHIDHDHDTGKIRGVLCSECNHNEGKIKKWAETLDTDIVGVMSILNNYLQNPPLEQSWVQKS